MIDRLRTPLASGNPVRSTRLLDLPDDLLMRVLQSLTREDGKLKADALRDVWNASTTCTRVHRLMEKVLDGLPAREVVMEEYVVQEVQTEMPEDVVQGTMFALRSISEEGRMQEMIRKVRLSAIAQHELQTMLQRLRGCSALEELCFVDAEGGVTMPNEIARRVQILTILLPRAQTLTMLKEAGCAPKKLELFRVDDDAAVELCRGAWQQLSRDCEDVDITWSGDIVPTCVNLLHQGEPIEVDSWYLKISNEQFQTKVFGTRQRGLSLFDSVAMRMEPDREEDEDLLISRFGWKPVHIRRWISCKMSNPRKVLRRRVDLVGEEGFLSVLVDSDKRNRSLLSNEGELLKTFVREMVLGGKGLVKRLHVAMSPSVHSENFQLMAEIATRLVHEAASAGIREFIVNSKMFMELAHKPLPASVTSVGVIGDFVSSTVSSTFLYRLPMSLAMLAADSRTVWMQYMPLRDQSDGWRRMWCLRRVESSIRQIEESSGLCAMGVRGVLERWMRET